MENKNKTPEMNDSINLDEMDNIAGGLSASVAEKLREKQEEAAAQAQGKKAQNPTGKNGMA